MIEIKPNLGLQVKALQSTAKVYNDMSDQWPMTNDQWPMTNDQWPMTND